AALKVCERIVIHPGLFAQSFQLPDIQELQFAFVHIDANVFQGTWEACQFTIPRTKPGGIVVFDDYNGVCDLGARLAIDRYFGMRAKELTPLAGPSVMLRL